MTSRKLMTKLDQAAEQLLDRYFTPPQLGENPPDPEKQIRAFDAVVKYYGPRTKLGVDEDKKESGIDVLRNKLNGGGASRRRANGAPQSHPDAGGDPAADPSGGTEH